MAFRCSKRLLVSTYRPHPGDVMGIRQNRWIEASTQRMNWLPETFRFRNHKKELLFWVGTLPVVFYFICDNSHLPFVGQANTSLLLPGYLEKGVQEKNLGESGVGSKKVVDGYLGKKAGDNF